MSSYSAKRTIIGHVEKGTDLYDSITRIAQQNNIMLGRVTGLGAVQKAKLAYYDQKEMKYKDFELNEPMEIVCMYGNISVKDGRPFVHAHVALSDGKGNARGGHLLPGGSPVFACEITIEEFEGPELVRGFDERTGLALWPKEKVL
ncbi:MAG: DNA-binding protein [Ignavibacteria bacterium]|nr:DNA-binding protein [Ignavibacteria bacterium]